MTTENNKLLAEFMGLTQTEINYYYFPKFERAFRLGDLKFHSDWNWLMEVVEKIESIENTRFDFQINQYNVRIYDHENIEFIVELNRDTKIKAVYNACISFVKWYNENKI